MCILEFVLIRDSRTLNTVFCVAGCQDGDDHQPRERSLSSRSSLENIEALMNRYRKDGPQSRTPQRSDQDAVQHAVSILRAAGLKVDGGMQLPYILDLYSQPSAATEHVIHHHMGSSGSGKHLDTKMTVCSLPDGHRDSDAHNRLAKSTLKEVPKEEGVLHVYDAGSVATWCSGKSSIRGGSPGTGSGNSEDDRDRQLSAADVAQPAVRTSENFTLPHHGDRCVNIRERIIGIR